MNKIYLVNTRLVSSCLNFKVLQVLEKRIKREITDKNKTREHILIETSRAKQQKNYRPVLKFRALLTVNPSHLK
jgi:hypothetical protein